jgi:hypothetical protein
VSPVIGIEDQELLVGATETGDPFGDVAGLSRDVVRAPPIEDVRVIAGVLPQAQKASLFGDPGLRVGGVAEDENIELRGSAGLLQRFPDRLQSRHDVRGLLVIGWHQ